MILAGDIGGSKCNLAAFEETGPILRPVFECRYATRDFSSFEQLLGKFSQQVRLHLKGATNGNIRAAGFGVAGTVVEGRLHTINLPWVAEIGSLADSLKLRMDNVVVMNDLVATAWGLEKLSPEDFLVLNEGVPQPHANKALMAAGTGLGEAMLFWGGHGHLAAPSEGGAADFAPRNDREIRLLQYLKQSLPRVSCEEVFSGRGFRKIHEFLNPAVRHLCFEEASADSAKEITQNAMAGLCPVCVDTLDLWVEAFGAEAGNLALRVLAYAGFYLAGGIALKILPKLKEGAFCRSFSDKAPLRPVLARIPVFVVLNEAAPVLGAAYEAFRTVESR
jgi:glucokinase